nr:ATP-binding protein [bacterium]
MLGLKIPENIVLKNNIEDADIFADKFQLKIVILNILKNAIEKFSGANGEMAIVSKLIRKENGSEIMIIISDTGEPVSENADIFEPFYSTKTNGSGLGMSFSKLIIENHNGKISAYNKDGKVNFEI